MVVSCPKCKARFHLADEKISPKGVKVRCTKCSTLFAVRKAVPKPAPAAAANTPTTKPAPPPKDPFARDARIADTAFMESLQESRAEKQAKLDAALGEGKSEDAFDGKKTQFMPSAGQPVTEDYQAPPPSRTDVPVVGAQESTGDLGLEGLNLDMPAPVPVSTPEPPAPEDEIFKFGDLSVGMGDAGATPGPAPDAPLMPEPDAAAPDAPLMPEPDAAAPDAPLMLEPDAAAPDAPLMLEPDTAAPDAPLMLEPDTAAPDAPLMPEPDAAVGADAPLMLEPDAATPDAPLMPEPDAAMGADAPLMPEPDAAMGADAPLMPEPDTAAAPDTPLMPEPSAAAAPDTPLMPEPGAAEPDLSLMPEPGAAGPDLSLMPEPGAAGGAPEGVADPFGDLDAGLAGAQPDAAPAPESAGPLSPDPAPSLAPEPGDAGAAPAGDLFGDVSGDLAADLSLPESGPTPDAGAPQPDLDAPAAGTPDAAGAGVDFSAALAAAEASLDADAAPLAPGLDPPAATEPGAPDTAAAPGGIKKTMLDFGTAASAAEAQPGDSQDLAQNLFGDLGNAGAAPAPAPEAAAPDAAPDPAAAGAPFAPAPAADPFAPAPAGDPFAPAPAGEAGPAAAPGGFDFDTLDMNEGAGAATAGATTGEDLFAGDTGSLADGLPLTDNLEFGGAADAVGDGEALETAAARSQPRSAATSFYAQSDLGAPERPDWYGRALAVLGGLAALLLLGLYLFAGNRVDLGAFSVSWLLGERTIEAGQALVVEDVTAYSYATRAGRSLLVVEGQARNRTTALQAGARVRATIYDHVGRLVYGRTGYLGCVVGPREATRIEQEDDLDRVCSGPEPEIAPGEAAPFVVVFFDAPTRIGRYRYSVDISTSRDGRPHAAPAPEPEPAVEPEPKPAAG